MRRVPRRLPVGGCAGLCSVGRRCWLLGSSDGSLAKTPGIILPFEIINVLFDLYFINEGPPPHKKKTSENTRFYSQANHRSGRSARSARSVEQISQITNCIFLAPTCRIDGNWTLISDSLHVLWNCPHICNIDDENITVDSDR